MSRQTFVPLAFPRAFRYLLYPLDLYSDAGSYALHAFKQQYLYNEVEAEVRVEVDLGQSPGC